VRVPYAAARGCARVCLCATADAVRGIADAKQACLEQPHEATQPVVSAPAPEAAPAPATSSASSEVSSAISQLRRAAGAEEVAGSCARLQAAMQEGDLRAGILERIEDVIVSCHPARPSMPSSSTFATQTVAPACQRRHAFVLLPSKHRCAQRSVSPVESGLAHMLRYSIS